MIDIKISNKLFSFVSNEAKMMQFRGKNMQNSVVKLQIEILESHRIICLIPYYMFAIDNRKFQVQNEQTYLSNMTDSNLIINLLRPKKATNFSNLAMLNQETSFLISYLENNSSDLACEIIKAKTALNTMDFYHLIFQIIPSIFGYFHSSEHLNAASIFYQNVIDSISDNPNYAIRIFQPFLNSPATYRYIEFVTTKIFKKILLYDLFNKFSNVSFDDKMSNLYKEYTLIKNIITKKFLVYLTKGASLLPKQILQIFRRIKNKHSDKWSIQNWYKLIFSVFIGTHFNRWARSHFYNKVKDEKKSKNHTTKSIFKKRAFSYPQRPVHPNFFGNVGIMYPNHPQSNEHKNDPINDILANVLNNLFKRDFDNLIEALCTIESSYSLPQMYQCFEKCPQKYIFVVKDLAILVKFMKERKILPSFICPRNFEGFSNDYLNSIVMINNYQNNLIQNHIIKQPIIFPHYQYDPDIKNNLNQNNYKSNLILLALSAKKDGKNEWEYALEESKVDPSFHKYVENYISIQYSNITDSFEMYIENCRLIDEIKKWEDLLSQYANMIYLSYLGNFQKVESAFNLLPNNIKFMNELDAINDKIFEFNFNQYQCFSCDLDQCINNCLMQKQSINNFMHISNTNEMHQFKHVSTKFALQNQNISKMVKSDNSIIIKKLPSFFYKALSLFSMIQYVNIPEKYNIFMTFLNIISDCFPKNDNMLFLLLIKHISASVLIKNFIEISTYAIYNEACLNYISTNDIAKWQKFENMIYITISDNDEIYHNVLRCQIHFQDTFASINYSLSNAKRTKRNSVNKKQAMKYETI